MAKTKSSAPKYKIGEIVIYEKAESNQLFLISHIDSYTQVWGGVKGNWYYRGEVMHLVESTDPNLPLIPIVSHFEEDVLERDLGLLEKIIKKEKVV